ncbi:hypothetical protein Lbir_0037 [Legionella birminghamensis]|uniref:Uncharacterized protein n=1 Tax=Legionella birminghamensis TaxID=28083 RepID=A0A378IIU5_9GAMM|nr:hypothetical protein Lbir_0037 [Legionella birminghamensis]STX32094.1 Uncharacterised protein [Legionella birminghamensis]
MTLTKLGIILRNRVDTIESPRLRPRGPYEANLMLSTLVYDDLLNPIFWQH